MKYTVYKITNKINGKFYIGKHQTKNLDDGYMGSGKLLKRAIKKYGVENFSKEILYIFETEEEMNAKEKELVIVFEKSYNLCEGGKGGFGYINKMGLNWTPEKNNLISGFRRMSQEDVERFRQYAIKGGKVRAEQIAKLSVAEKKAIFTSCSFKGRNHTEENKHKISIAMQGKQSGSRNSQYGRPRSEETKQKIRESLLKRRSME